MRTGDDRNPVSGPLFYRRLPGGVKSAILPLIALLLLGAADEDDFARSRNLEETLGTLSSAFSRGEVDSVLSVFDGELAGRQLTARLHNLHGISLAAVGRHREAVEAFERGIRMAYHRPELHLNLAISLLELGVTGRAMAEFEEALELGPDSVEAHLGYGRSLLRFRRYEEAREVLDRAHSLDPTDARVQRTRAELAHQWGGPEQEREIWTWLEENRPSAESAKRLGELTADPRVAAEYFEHCLERDSDADDCRERAAGLHLQSGRAVRAVELLAPRAETLSEAGYQNLLLAEQSRGQLAPLEKLVAERPPAMARGWAILALARRDAGELESALDAARRAAALDPDDLEVVNLLAVLLAETGETEAARDRWEWILEQNPDHEAARRNLEARLGG